MGHVSHKSEPTIQVIPADKAKIRKIWITALILAVLTAIEFLFAFTIPRGIPLIIIFVVLTFVKSFYIVAEFMHLKHEVKLLIWSVLIPCLFIAWLVVALLTEGNAVFNLRMWVQTWF
jgi:cytochrome c oxidase subunit 4